MARIESAWQKRVSWTLLLLPLAMVFSCIVRCRRLAYKAGLLSCYRPAIPVIVVGNITVGGSGKTPTVLWLCQLLRQAGYSPGVISRGYGGESAHYPLRVHPSTDPVLSGDEPLLIARRSGCPVVVDPVRSRAAKEVEALGCDVIVTDDGLQHYALARDIELVVVDGVRRFGNGLPLPAGPMREPKSRLKTVFACICNGGKPQGNEWSMVLKPAHQWHSVFDDATVTQGFFQKKRVLALAGIGNPQRFFNTLSALGISADCVPLADHAPINAQQFAHWQKEYDIILMTEKDAVKCRHLTPGLCFYLPVEAVVAKEQAQTLLTALAHRSQENSNGVRS